MRGISAGCGNARWGLLGMHDIKQPSANFSEGKPRSPALTGSGPVETNVTRGKTWRCKCRECRTIRRDCRMDEGREKSPPRNQPSNYPSVRYPTLLPYGTFFPSNVVGSGIHGTARTTQKEHTGRISPWDRIRTSGPKPLKLSSAARPRRRKTCAYGSQRWALGLLRRLSRR